MKKPTTRRGAVRILKSKVVFRGPVFYVSSEMVKEPAGIEGRRDIIHHPGSVVVLVGDATQRQPRVLLARQYRYAAGARLWLLPAGRIDGGETELAAAKPALLEG